MCWRDTEKFDDVLNALALGSIDSIIQGLGDYVPVGKPRVLNSTAHRPDLSDRLLLAPNQLHSRARCLQSKVRKALAECDHPSGPGFVDDVLTLAASMPCQGRDRLVAIFDGITKCDVRQTVVLPSGPGPIANALEQLSGMCGEFQFHPFDGAAVRDFALRAKHPWGSQPERFDQRLGRWAISRIKRQVTFLDTFAIEHDVTRDISYGPERPDDASLRSTANLFAWAFSDTYWQEQEQHLTRSFFQDLWWEQSFHVALGGTAFPVREMQVFDLTVFHQFQSPVGEGVGQRLLVSEREGSTSRVLAHLELALYNSERLDVPPWVGGCLKDDPLFQTFAELLSEASEVGRNGKGQLAFVLQVTALELLLTNDNLQVTDQLRRRLAALVSLTRDKPFSELRKEINEIYSARSAVVHRGDKSKVFDLIAYCRTAFECALRAFALRTDARSEATSKRRPFLQEWHLTLDYLAAALDAGVAVDGFAATRAGIELDDEQGSS